MVVLSVTCEDKKTPLSAEELKEFAQLQNDIELYKAKLRSEFGYSNKDIKAGLELVLLVNSLHLILGNGENGQQMSEGFWEGCFWMFLVVCPASCFGKWLNKA